ncbi:hypothetical protein COE81_19715 [Bacillus wiedmannii]|uniref:hypothetical protein n=1 Tax=Bacillus wiedmannii TaxID=1890302 RepID=UPI000BFE023D|nr:hypothetical protein [Bacillus wiedmannii]PHB04902.1 hypothetical protein COE81_19715 [Bacillus wiedmannii]
MSMNEITDLTKIIGVAIGIWGFFKSFALLYIEFSTSEGIDKLFKDKTKIKQLNILTFWQEVFLIALSIFIIPASYFKFFMPSLISDYSHIIEPIFNLSFVIFTFLFFILIPIAIIPIERLNNFIAFNQIIKFTVIIHMFSFMFSYWCFFHINISKSDLVDFILISIYIPIFISIFYKYLGGKFQKHNQTEFFVEILSEDELKELELVHDFILNDKKSILHEKYKSRDETFYLCDFSSKVYLKYSKKTKITPQQ